MTNVRLVILFDDAEAQHTNGILNSIQYFLTTPSNLHGVLNQFKLVQRFCDSVRLDIII